MDTLRLSIGNLSWMSFGVHFAPMLQNSPNFNRVPVEQQHKLFGLYKEQLIEDMATQASLIQGITNRSGATPLVIETGRSMISRLQTAIVSPSFMDCAAIEDEVQSNWQPVGKNGGVTIPELLSLFASGISSRWTHTPSRNQRNTLGLTADYGRAKGHQESIFKELVDHHSLLLFGVPTEQIKATQNIEMLQFKFQFLCLKTTNFVF
jgi:hypothetical protein